jgi:hypothetical protein
VIPVFAASQTEFDLAALVVGAMRWRRLDGRYVPGGGEDRGGYAIGADTFGAELAGNPHALDLELAALWDDES